MSLDCELNCEGSRVLNKSICTEAIVELVPRNSGRQGVRHPESSVAKTRRKQHGDQLDNSRGNQGRQRIADRLEVLQALSQRVCMAADSAQV